MKKILFLLILTSVFSCTPSAKRREAAAPEGGMTIENLGPGNRYVRIDSRQKYLLLPVQEGVPSWTANIVVDTRPPWTRSTTGYRSTLLRIMGTNCCSVSFPAWDAVPCPDRLRPSSPKRWPGRK